METILEKSDLAPESILPLAPKNYSWTDRVQSTTPLTGGFHSTNCSSIKEQIFEVCQVFEFQMFHHVNRRNIFKHITFLNTKGNKCLCRLKLKPSIRGVLEIFFSSKQALALASLKKLAHWVNPHASLNFSRGVISAVDLYNVSTEEIFENMADQKVCGVRRITIRRDGQVLNTKHLILTFATPDLPQSVKAAYLNCLVRLYIQNSCVAFNASALGITPTKTNQPALAVQSLVMKALTAKIERSA
ncbi:RNA-directed DNA polymerase from mobile element jockey [Trichonephila clavata]|uniref:RNA-directed DNA polymerase from mobile element jockey n=1 Tax=Trichonephila clavata TaxID=2740835 RepID=A0A8X6IDQ0_TRICU|nr:RNA-directed DNA polymerase from mobile element jockey [Trichonephila clavata]